jgi:hypothetical protein
MDDDLKHDNGDHGGHHDDLSIRVNTERTDWDRTTITFEQVVSIAYDGNPPTGDSWVFDVDYRKGPKANPQGILERGQSVEVCDGMLFDVTGTDNS